MLYAKNTESNLVGLDAGKKAEMVESLAAPLARDYAEKNYRKLSNGMFEPAWRGAEGEKAYKGKSPEEVAEMEQISVEEARKKLVDIANQDYSTFSEYWKAQNRGGARYFIDLLSAVGAAEILNTDIEDPNTQEHYGDLIHNDWLLRNSWASDDPVLGLCYADLPVEEQRKDIDQFRVFQDWLAKYLDAAMSCS